MDNVSEIHVFTSIRTDRTQTRRSHTGLAHACLSYVAHMNTKVIELGLDLCSVLVLHLLRQFDELPDAREKLKKEVGLKWVDGIPGVRVQCGNIPCVFEFVTYKYKSHNRLQPTNTSSMPLEEPDNGAAVAQPKNGDGTTENWTEEETPSPDLAHPDTQWFMQVKGKPQHPLTPRQPGTRSPTRFISLDNGPRVMHFGSHTHSIATTTTATLTSSTSPVHTPIDTTETTPTTKFHALTATNGSIQSTEDAHPSMRDSTLSDPELSQTLLPNNDTIALQLYTDALIPKPKRPVQRDDLSPTNSLGPALNAQHYTSSGTSPLHMRKKPDKNFPVTPQGATQPTNAHNYRSNDRESQSQMNLDGLLELLPTSGTGADNSSTLHDNDAVLTAINGHTVDNKAFPEEGSERSTEV